MNDAMFGVVDPSSIDPNAPPRRHQILVDGGLVTYEFSPGVPTRMPEAHAMKFLASGFPVVDEKDRSVKGFRKSEPDGSVPALAPDEVIASLDELTQEALLVRAQAAPGGEAFKRGAKKSDLIDFLVASGGLASSDEQPASDPDIEEMGADELHAMFGD